MESSNGVQSRRIKMANIKLTQAEVNKAQATGKRYSIRDTEIQGLLLRVGVSGDKVFYVDYYDSRGKRTMRKIGRADTLSISQARDAAKELLAKAALGLEVGTKREKRTKGQTLGEFLEELYIPWVLDNRKSGKATVQMLRRSFKCFYDVEVDKLTQMDLEKWQIDRVKENKEASVNRVMTTIKAALNWGVKRGILKENPLTHMERLKETTSPGRVRYLSDEERTRLLDALERHDKRTGDHIKPMVMIALNTGMRRGSLFGLVWGDVDFDQNTIRLRAEEAKSGKQNYIPMNKTVREILTDWKKRSKSTASSSLVFPSPKTGGRIDNCNSSWESLMRTAQIENFRWHDMRHDFASRLVMSGVDLNTVRELLGHADLKMTLRYAHLAPAAKQKAVDALDDDL